MMDCNPNVDQGVAYLQNATVVTAPLPEGSSRFQSENGASF